MEMKYCVFLLILTFGIDTTTGEKLSSVAACKEASSLLEMVMFFPMSMCGQENPESSGAGNEWTSRVIAYSDTFVYFLNFAKSRMLPSGYLGFKGYQLYLEEISHSAQQYKAKMTSYVTKHTAYLSERTQKASEKFGQILNRLKKTIWDTTTKIKNVSRSTVNVVLPYFSKISTPLQLIGTLIFGLSDVTMTLKACAMTFLDKWVTTLTCSPCLYVRYAFAGILLLSLPFSVYTLVKEAQGKIQTREAYQRPHRKGTKCTKNQLSEETSSWTNVFNLGQVSHFTRYIFSSNEADSDTEKDKTLMQLHYRMCEIYDGCDCNCGGGTTPISAWRSDHVTRFKLKPTHYRMCEYYDKMACNCGGFLRKSPVSPQISRRYYNDIATNTVEISKDTVDKEQQVESVDEKVILEMSIENGKHCVDQYEIAKQDLNSTSMLTEVSMMEEIDNIEKEIGYPKFNSSFIEDSPLASTLTDSAYSDRASGDGPMLVITRRSPRKECGISFTEDESISYLDDSVTDEEDSLLDVSDINKTLSFNSGDGVYEFVILCVLQTIFRTAKRFFEAKMPRRLHDPQPSIGDLSQDTYFVISRKSRSRHNKQSLNKNQSATVNDEDESDTDTSSSITDESLTDYDRISDVSACYADISEHNVQIGLGSLSISSGSDCSNLLGSEDGQVLCDVDIKTHENGTGNGVINLALTNDDDVKYMPSDGELIHSKKSDEKPIDAQL